MTGYPIPCGQCSQPTGAWFHGGDPYLPFILCGDCHDEAERAEIEAAE